MLRRMFLAAPLPFLFKGRPDESRPRCRKREEAPVPEPVRVLYRTNDDLTVHDTADEGDLFRYAVPAGLLDGDHGLRVTLDGESRFYGVGSRTVYFRLRYGDQVYWGQNSNMSSDIPSFQWRITFDFMAWSSNQMQEVFLQQNLGGTAVSAYGNSSLVDATLEHDLAMTAHPLDGADPDLVIECRRAIVEWL